MGFPGSSAGKESICNARHPGSIPGLWRSAREGIGYPLQHSWTSLVAQLVKNSSAMWQILTFNLTMNVIWIVPSKIADGKKKKGRKGRKNNGRVNEFASVTFFFLFFFFFSLYVGDIYTSTQHLLLDCQSWELSFFFFFFLWFSFLLNFFINFFFFFFRLPVLRTFNEACYGYTFALKGMRKRHIQLNHT